MENRKLIKLLIPIFVLGFFVANFNSAFAYEIETHAYLTNEVVKLYNQNFPNNKINEELMPYLLDGARQEDDIPRWMNHFYDPVYNRGLTDSVLGTWQKSKDWAQDSNNQNSLTYKVPATIASVLTAIQQQKISAISTYTDFTWQQAIKFYVQDEKEKAMFMLGHILHLIEDSSVPDHTRNDPHPGDSPYENYTQQFTLNNSDKNLFSGLKNKQLIILSGLNSYFDELGKYSNNNFYSRSTIGIQSGYKIPEPENFELVNNFYYGIKRDENGIKYYLVLKKSREGSFLFTTEYDVSIDDWLVKNDYWSLLSTKSVQYGAGVVNLFFQEVEKAKNDPNFTKTEEKSIFAKAFEATKNLFAQVSSTVSGIFKNDGVFQPAGEVSLNQSQDSSISGNQTSNIAPQNIKQCSFNVSQSPSRQKAVINEVAWMGSVNSANDEWIELKNISNTGINLSGYQLIDQAEQIKIVFGENDKISANGFYLLERTNDNTVLNIKADKIYTGQLSNTNEGLRLFDSNCNLIDEVFANPNWPAGDNSAKKTMERANDFSWHTSNIVGGTPKKENSQPVVVKKQEPLINLLEETEEDNEEITPQQQKQIQQATSSLQQTQQTTNFKQCSFQTNQSPSRQKVIINEVAWMGTINSANDEWIELKNISNSEVDLNSWQLIDKAEQIKVIFGQADNRKIINKKISAGGFYLLERTDDNSVPTVTADFVYTGILSNSDEGLRIFDQNCNLVDEVFADPNWPAGDNTQKRTMERSPDLSWHTYNGIAQNGIFGTPKRENSAPTIATTSGSGGGGGSSNQQPTTNDQQQATSTAKILINEIQIAGGTANDEFIELYNPNSQSVNLTGWSVKKKTSSGNEYSLLSSSRLEGKFILPKNYVLLANEEGYGGSVTPDVFWAKSNTIAKDNTIILYDSNQNVIDKVGFGLAADCKGNCALNPETNQSIQRKFENNTFIDTDNNANDFEIQTCPSPKAPSKTCQQANQAPRAFFVYTPSAPQIGEQITFDASYSTDPDPDGQIVSYQWDFGDNSTPTVSTATTTHFYSSAGNYLVGLIVFNNQNASSTSTSTTISVALSGVVISEIMAGTTASSSDEFIELYNPTNNPIDLTGWELRKRTSTDSENNLVDDGKFVGSIPAKGFFLITHTNYSGSKVADLKYSTTAEIAYSNNSVVLYNGDYRVASIVDLVSYDEIQKDKSLERRAFSNGICVSAQNDNEFFGNGCDQDYDNDDDNNTTDFEIRDTPNPQNSLSLLEPRTSPTTPENFNIQYNSSTMGLDFNWGESSDASSATSTVIYEIQEYSSPGVIIFRATSTTQFHKSIIEIGRDYQFSIQAFDKDGLGSATSTASTTVASFFSGLYFYQDPRDTTKNLIEAYYNQYPFTPDLHLYYDPPNSTWKLLVFYLNSEAKKQSDIYAIPYQPNNLENVLAIKYKHCSGGVMTQENSLLLPDIFTSNRCGTGGGATNITFDYSELEDNHFIIQTASSSQELILTNQNYLTVAFYSTVMVGVGPLPSFRLVAVDKTKYYFGNPATHQPPTPPTDFQIVFQEQSETPYFSVSWATSTDPDSLDKEINYQLDYWPENNPTGKNQWTGKQNSIQIAVSSSGNYIFELKACDEFNLCSEIVSTSAIAFIPVVLADTTNYSEWNTFTFGGKSSLETYPPKIAQSFEIIKSSQITSFTIGLSNSVDYYNNPSGAKIFLGPANEGLPSEQEIISFSLRPDEIPRYNTYVYNNGVKEFSFFLSPAIELNPGIYFLVIEPEDSPSDGFWNLVILYSGNEYYREGMLYKKTSQGEWMLYDSRDTYFRLKGFINE